MKNARWIIIILVIVIAIIAWITAPEDSELFKFSRSFTITLATCFAVIQIIKFFKKKRSDKQ